MKTDLRLLPAATTCRCAGCEGLAARYGSDPDLLSFYKMGLLHRGWGGSTDDVERAYQVAHAGWAKTAQENGLRLAQEMGRRERVAQPGEASAATDGKFASREATQLPLALGGP